MGLGMGLGMWMWMWMGWDGMGVGMDFVEAKQNETKWNVAIVPLVALFHPVNLRLVQAFPHSWAPSKLEP